MLLTSRRHIALDSDGDITDYCQAAARLLGPDGRFCFCHAAADPRPEGAVARAGLELLGRREVIFKEGRPPHLGLFCCGWPDGEGAKECDELPPLVIRDAMGRWTEEYIQVRRDLLMEEQA